jgi:hypothetical protein
MSSTPVESLADAMTLDMFLHFGEIGSKEESSVI